MLGVLHVGPGAAELEAPGSPSGYSLPRTGLAMVNAREKERKISNIQQGAKKMIRPYIYVACYVKI